MVFSIQLVPISELAKHIPRAIIEKRQEVHALLDSWLLLLAGHTRPLRNFEVACYFRVTQ